MKIKVKNREYEFITDNSQEITSKGAFLLTEHNKKYKTEAQKAGCKFFLKAENLFKEWNLKEIKIIGITGTNGKTSVSNIVAHLLKDDFKIAVSGTEGVFLHWKNKIKKIVERSHTTPEILTTLNNLKIAKEKGAKFFVMEVSSHGIYQKRIEGLKFSAKVFTNLSQDHLDFHKTMKNYADIKSSFFSDGRAKIINIDDKWIKYNEKKLFSYSLKKGADLVALNYSFKNGIESNILYKNKKYFLKSSMIGKFNLYNLLASIGVILKLKIFSIEEVLEKISNFSGVEGRMEIIYKKDNLIIFSDYAHTPDAVKNVLSSLDEKRKIITVIGAGGDRDRLKRPKMAKEACLNSDFVILTSDNPRWEKAKDILQDMEYGVKNKYNNYEIIIDRKKAIKKAVKKARAELKNGGKVSIAILGKGAENYMEVKGEKIPYSDKEEILKEFI